MIVEVNDVLNDLLILVVEVNFFEVELIYLTNRLLVVDAGLQQFIVQIL